jgi:hypothetical protein
MFDKPDMATTNNHLYLTFNVFDTSVNPNRFLSAVIFKFSLSELAALQPLNFSFQRLDAPTGRIVAFARGATTDMFFAGNLIVGGNLRIFRWPDLPLNAPLTQFDVNPSVWVGGVPPPGFFPPAYSAPGPGGEWLAKLDGRVAGGWVSGNQVGFVWSANRDLVRPMPYVKVVVVDVPSQTIVAQPDIHNPGVAFAYPSVCPNVNGTVGISLFMGGGATDPMHTVGFLDGTQWVLQGSIVSSNAPPDTLWGDYVSCATHDPTGVDWVAAGFTLQGGTAPQNIDPQYVRFGVGP